MKKLLILSGKGGTGKTTVAAAFISLEKARAYADCDVDAPNLHLVIKELPEPERFDYFGMGKAFIDEDSCIGCGICAEACRFQALSMNDANIAVLSLYACEGCGLCERLCPVGAITMVDDIAGQRMLYRLSDEGSYVKKEQSDNRSRNTVFSTAELKMGSGTSGKLVSEVKKCLYDNADKDASLAIIDGSPGIGCPVIASITGVDEVLIVAEPSVSGISDMKRIVETAGFFGVGISVCANKADTNPEKTLEIRAFCDQNDLLFVGEIPYDPHVNDATNAGISIDQVDCPAADAIRVVYDRVRERILG
ncbi:MAG: ATP-binding protein [Clostridiales bacterium]|nr:ATP-binding protein [Clostridiales bacterium]